MLLRKLVPGHVLMLLPIVTSFLTNQCPAPSCDCISSTIFCSLRHLRTFPKFTNESTIVYRDLSVYLDNNQITEIPANAFRNIHSTNTMEVGLSNNNISKISVSAFKGVESVTTKIDLKHNDLQDIPAALASLHNLHELTVQYNPIPKFNKSVLHALGKSVEKIEFGSSSLQTWPYGTRYLSNLRILSAYGIPVNTSIPLDAFHGLENLRYLNFKRTGLQGIPEAVCSLAISTNDQFDLNFDDNLASVGHKLIPTCKRPLVNVTWLHFQNNNLTSFPSVFGTFPNLRVLVVTNNPHLRFIDDSVIPTDSNVVVLSLQSNTLEQIPAAILKMRKLYSLDLSYNKILSIEFNNLDFPQLNTFDMTSNPIQHMSINAFRHTPELKKIYLFFTKLTAVPRAIMYAPNVTYVSMTGNKIVCSCDLLWFKSLTSKRRVSVDAVCSDSSQTVDHFVRTGLGNCSTNTVAHV